MPRFLLRPRWIGFHLLVVVGVVAFVNLALWQLDRRAERTERNDLIEARRDEPARPVAEVLPADADLDAARAVEWAEVVVEGTYDAEGQVLVRNRSLDGAPGLHVLTPLVLASGDAVVVNRGFVPLGTAVGELPRVAVPEGPVVVTGRVRPSQERGSVGPRDPAEGTLDALVRADLVRLARQLPYRIPLGYVELDAQDPPPSAQAPPVPVPVPVPALDAGPHLSYAAQWAFFAGLAVVGWVVVVRKSLRAHLLEQRAAARAAHA